MHVCRCIVCLQALIGLVGNIYYSLMSLTFSIGGLEENIWPHYSCTFNFLFTAIGYRVQKELLIIDLSSQL